MFRFLSLLLVLPALAESRTFTSSDGKTIQANVVAATDETVTLLRDSDQRTFKLPLTRLSKSDIAHITAWRSHLDHPLGWRRLRIHGAGQSIVASCLPIYGPIDGREAWRTASNATIELTLPVGAWVHVGIHPHGARVEGLVEYKGASDWYLSSRDNILSIRTGPKAKAIPAVVQSRPDAPANSLAPSQGAALRAGASLTKTVPKGDPSSLPRIRYQAAKLHLLSLNWSQLPPSLRALQIHTPGAADLAGLKRFPNLEHLSISASSITGLNHLSSHSKLRSLYLNADFFDPTELGYLGPLDSLRQLSLHSNERSSSGNELYSFLSAHTQLESLALTYGSTGVVVLDATLIKNCQRLTRIDFALRGAGKESALTQLPFLTDISLAQLRSESTLKLMQSGHFKHLHTIRKARFRDPLINVPNLRNLQLGANAWPSTPPAWAQLPFLERVVLRCPSREALVRFCSHQAFQSLHHLVLQPGTGFEFDPLAQLPKLRSLKLESPSATGSFDMAAFPNLHALELFNSRYLDIPSLQNLRALRLEGSNIDRLGDGSSTKLGCLEIIGSKLVNLNGLKGSSSLKSLHLEGCDRLESHASLTDRRSLDHIFVGECPGLTAQAAN